MEFLVGVLLVAGVGWLVWLMLTPPVLFRVMLKDGEVRVSGRLPPQSVRDIEEFFRTNFPSERNLRVTVMAASAEFRSRIQISGAVTEDEQQMIRNFLLTRI